MKSKTENTNWTELVETLLEDDHRLILRMKGFSMYPCLKPGDKGVVEKCILHDLRPGDIIVFKQNGSLVAHRLMHRNHDVLMAKGDHNKHYDPVVKEDALIGRVIRVERKGKDLSTTALRFKIASVFNRRATPLATRLNQLVYLKDAGLTALKRYTNDFKANFSIASRDVKPLLYLNTVIAVLQGLIPFAVIVLVKLLVDLLSTLPSTGTIPPMFVVLLVLTGLAFLLSSVLLELKSWLSEKLSQGVVRSMYALLHDRHIRLGLSHYENSKELDKIHRAVQEASFRPVKLLNEVQHLLKSIAASLFLVGIFISIRWYLVVVLLVAVLPGMLLKITFARRYHRLKEQQSPLERKMYYFNRVLTGFPFAKEMKLFGFAGYFLKRFRGLQSELFKGRLQLRRSEMIQNILAQSFAVVLIFSTLALVSHWMVAGLLSIGTVVMFFFAFQRGYSVLSDLLKSMANLLEDTIFMNDFKSFVELRELADVLPETTPAAFSLQRSIRVKNVSFRYINSKRDALQSVNLEIPAGQTVAIVGANGSGKTTLIKLLCGFYLPDTGTIHYDDATTAELGREAICRNLSAVFQDFALYNVTAAENIALGNIQRDYSVEKMKESASQAGISDVLEQLPQAYSTLLGNQFTGGEELSIGQWQKLAIARAFYRDSPLLLMDEPSSALDAVAEQQIIDTLKTLAHRKTAVIISHRLSTVKWADRIIVFDEGRVVEEGTHDELIQLDGTYALLYRQATRSYETN